MIKPFRHKIDFPLEMLLVVSRDQHVWNGRATTTRAAFTNRAAAMGRAAARLLFRAVPAAHRWLARCPIAHFPSEVLPRRVVPNQASHGE